MVETKTVIRTVAIVGMLGASGLFAAKATILSGPSQAQTADATPVIETASTPDVAPQMPQPPQISASADVQLPSQAAVPVPVPVPAAAPAPVPAPVPVHIARLAQETAPVPSADTADTNVSALGLPCGLSITATAMDGAMAAIDVMDPCQPNARVQIEHAGLTLTAQTDAVGLLTMDIPALETPAFFAAQTESGETITTAVGVPDLAEYDRVAVAWQDNRELELHAMELGAEFGGPGHIWDNAPGQIADAISGQGGFLVELGDATVSAPHLAQIYTFPRAGLSMGGSVRMSVDAPITEANCGKPVSAQSLQLVEGGALEMIPISLTLPGCDAVGDYLVLQNLFQDLRLASN
jgi:hypothetical protein